MQDRKRMGKLNLLNWITMILAAAGMFVSAILTYSHLAEKEVFCGVSLGCEAVAAHPSSMVGKIPIAAFGLILYLILFTGSLIRPMLTGKSWDRLSNVLVILAGMGFGYSGYLQYIAFYQVGATCTWCLTSFGLITALFVVHGIIAQFLSSDESEPRLKVSDWSVAGFCLLLSVAAFGFTAVKMDNKQMSILKTEDPAVIVPEKARMTGNLEAKVAIIEFADINCPGCRRAYDFIERLLEANQDKMMLGYRHFPLYNIPGHETSISAAILAELAGQQGKYFEFLSAAYSKENASRIKSVDGLLAIGEEMGLKKEEMTKALSGESTLFDKVIHDFEVATDELGLLGTPTFIILVEDRPARALSAEGLHKAVEVGYLKEYLKSVPLSDEPDDHAH